MHKILFFLLAVISPSQAFANEGQITNPVIGDYGKPDIAGESSFVAVTLVRFWRILIVIGALAVILFFVWGAIEWITSGGDSSKVEKGRNRITQAVIGLVLLVMSFAIIGFFGDLLFGDEFDILNLTFPRPDGYIPPATLPGNCIDNPNLPGCQPRPT